MQTLFGTDGIRGRANEEPLVPETMTQLGYILARLFCKKPSDVIIIGRDTRISGDMLEASLASGIFSAGANVISAGVLPTPGVAHAVVRYQAAAGVVISASHNPYYDNGIKIFDQSGFKLRPETETRIEEALRAFEYRKINRPADSGCWIRSADVAASYLEFLRNNLQPNYSAEQLVVVLDCSHGATCDIAPRLLKKVGAQVKAIGITPNGRNINADCGSEYPQQLAQTVLTEGAHLGLAFDGDGDRLIAVDEMGGIVRGDQLLLIFAEHLQQQKRLVNNQVVSTVMSNMGLSVALQARGIQHYVTDVGDRQVMAALRARGAILGGEDSGHIILARQHTTGDGLLSALLLMEVLLNTGQPLSRLAAGMPVFPQILLNVTTRHKPDLKTIPEVQHIITAVTNALQGQGRVLVRYSGTQPLCRVMVEGPHSETIKQYAEDICGVLEKYVGDQ